MASALAFFAYFFLGIGPGIVFFFYFLMPKAFVVLVSFTSAFYWLIVLLLTSGFGAINGVLTEPGPALGFSLVIQEVARVGLWYIHRATLGVISTIARNAGHRFDTIDKLYIALGWGFGHAACHIIFFYLSLLPLTSEEGTWYMDACPSMSIFLAGALYSLAFGMILTSIMVVAFEGWSENKLHHKLYAPVMHVTAAFVAYGNQRRHGCMVAMPVLLALGVLNVLYAARVCWLKGAHVTVPQQQDGDASRTSTELLAAGPSSGAVAESWIQASEPSWQHASQTQAQVRSTGRRGAPSRNPTGLFS